MHQLALHPLLEAMRRATPAERKSVANGLDTLARLLSTQKKQTHQRKTNSIF
jgi:hypothetical protein